MMSEETTEDTCVASTTQSLAQTHINGDNDEDKSSLPTPTAANNNGNAEQQDEDTNNGVEASPQQEDVSEDHENGESTEEPTANNGKHIDDVEN